VPTVSSPAKIARIESYGADLVVGGDRYADAFAASEAWAAESDALQVHAFDQPETLLGQGTLGLELAEQAPDLDTVLVAVGGGGAAFAALQSRAYQPAAGERVGIVVSGGNTTGLEFGNLERVSKLCVGDGLQAVPPAAGPEGPALRK